MKLNVNFESHRGSLKHGCAITNVPEYIKHGNKAGEGTASIPFKPLSQA